MIPIVLLLAACASGPGAATTGTTGAPALHGERVADAKAAPTFSKVVAMDGTPRDRSALIGHPTALWFYPAAGTPG